MTKPNGIGQAIARRIAAPSVASTYMYRFKQPARGGRPCPVAHALHDHIIAHTNIKTYEMRPNNRVPSTSNGVDTAQVTGIVERPTSVAQRCRDGGPPCPAQDIAPRIAQRGEHRWRVAGGHLVGILAQADITNVMHPCVGLHPIDRTPALRSAGAGTHPAGGCSPRQLCASTSRRRQPRPPDTHPLTAHPRRGRAPRRCDR